MASKIQKTIALIEKVIERETEKLSRVDKMQTYRLIAAQLNTWAVDMEIDDDEEDGDRAA